MQHLKLSVSGIRRSLHNYLRSACVGGKWGTESLQDKLNGVNRLRTDLKS